MVHGHQADFTSSQLHGLSRFAVRYIWKNLRLLSFGSALSREKDFRKKWGRFGEQVVLWVRVQLTKIEQRMVSWVETQKQMIICGHTHRPMAAAYAAPPYFNTGCGVAPGTLTGIEIQNGEIALVQWSADGQRRLLSRPRQLSRFHRPAT